MNNDDKTLYVFDVNLICDFFLNTPEKPPVSELRKDIYIPIVRKNK